ncbi:hypothetical protein J3Q64DRAFT_1694835 [Phycomyces blakesleeanus]|uniref:Uncharacterized protein n=2 Tax=Phycomyces blakesleeanus TaxID=4837 RepID=A0A163B7X4_PHYB8|nr:hypothetical protein PHYBLDRAFT_163823 [Phycomyces blakesleeanus NRRL 1555(-)]OAD78731.1 hypothetical protein PHYBLDRAFT_163823 [Phycomyces blakesleeanus NRRL 1555(-)]|eukprot:XP_018296771.1 hypothetical protein PHYBLDRAFT_163823 [Phycomyces blakesleeanus NRRL 1555(-)]
MKIVTQCVKYLVTTDTLLYGQMLYVAALLTYSFNTVVAYARKSTVVVHNKLYFGHLKKQWRVNREALSCMNEENMIIRGHAKPVYVDYYPLSYNLYQCVPGIEQ